MDALIKENNSKIQALKCRIVNNENAHREKLSIELERQEHILTEKHEKEVSELNSKISLLETTIKALTDKFNDAMTFIKELCMSAATLIFAKNECRADLTKPQRNAVRDYERTADFLGGDKMNIFKEVKAAVDINTAAEYYGLNVRKDTAICPFHNEKTGSLKQYHDHFYCFGCGEHGDVIKLTGKLLGLSPIDSARRLAVDFNVLIHDDFKPREQTRNKVSRHHTDTNLYDRNTTLFCENGTKSYKNTV